MFENFDDKAIAAVMIAQQEAYQLGQKVIGTELLLLGLMAQGSNIVVPILKEQGLTLRGVQDAVESKLDTGRKSRLDEIPFAPETKHAFEKSIVGARQFQSSYVYPEHLFLAIVQPPETQASQLLQDIGLDVRQLEADLIRAILEKSPVTVGGDLPSRSEFSKADSLESLLTDLTKLAEQGKIDPVVGRAKEIQRVVQILGRRSKNNPILIGEPGVGKTAIAEGLAQRIVNCDVPETLLNQRVLSLDMGALMAGTQLRGEFEGRLKQLVTDIREAENIILLIDEVHTLVGTGSIGGSTDAANLLKPALARGEL
ncbi:MAG: Clp protease N-terminal domain-containing protein, partial [Cyanobacteria bacterium P01_F01_bin.42]